MYLSLYMYVCMYVYYVYIYIYVFFDNKDNNTGQDKRGRRRSAAIPPNELSQENVGNM